MPDYDRGIRKSFHIGAGIDQHAHLLRELAPPGHLILIIRTHIHVSAVLKQKVKRDILHNNILTSSGYITCPAEVAEHLHLRMGSDEWKAAHVHGKVNEIVVLFSDATDMSERAVVERSKYETLEKSKQTYSYLMLEVGIFGRRERSCFCRACFGARGRGVGTTDSNLAVAGCPKATRTGS